MRDVRAVLALTGAAFFWSGNFVAGRALRTDIDPATLNLLRWSLCLVLLLPWVGAKAWRSRQAIGRHWRLLVALGATGIAAFHTLVYVALRDSSAIDALLMLSLTPVAILGASALAGNVRPSASQWAGSAASLLGAAILLTHGEPARWAQLAPTQGTLCMLLAVVLWAAYSLCLRRRPRELASEVVFAASIVPAVVLLLGWVALTPHPPPFAMTARLAGSLAYIVVFASLAGFLLWSYGVAAIGPERAGLFVNLMPLFGAAQAIALLDETLRPSHIGGAVCVLAGIALVGTERRKAASPVIEAGAFEIAAAHAGQSHAAPRTPDESPCRLRTTGVVQRSENTWCGSRPATSAYSASTFDRPPPSTTRSGSSTLTTVASARARRSA